MKLVQLASGHRFARQLAAAYADSQLRKRGAIPAIKYNGNQHGDVWTDEQYDEAIVMRLRGKSHTEIAAALGRTVAAVSAQIGPEAPLWGRE